MKQLQLLFGLLLLAPFSGCATHLKNINTVNLRVAGNCDLCKNAIETAAYQKGIAEGDWNIDTKILKLAYDTLKTSADDALKRIAYAGYDNEKFLAPDDVYAELEPCCQYSRMQKKTIMEKASKEITVTDTVTNYREEDKNPLNDVYSAYFSTKDALVKDDGTNASVNASALAKAIREIDVETMTSEERSTWIRIAPSLLVRAEGIAEAKNTDDQRQLFVYLSNDLYELAKVFKAGLPLYLQHCPMYNDGEGADWLSKENAVKNPYYGSAMLTCGKITETIK